MVFVLVFGDILRKVKFCARFSPCEKVPAVRQATRRTVVFVRANPVRSSRTREEEEDSGHRLETPSERFTEEAEVRSIQ